MLRTAIKSFTRNMSTRPQMGTREFIEMRIGELERSQDVLKKRILNLEEQFGEQKRLLHDYVHSQEMLFDCMITLEEKKVELAKMTKSQL